MDIMIKLLEYEKKMLDLEKEYHQLLSELPQELLEQKLYYFWIQVRSLRGEKKC